eukprot:COSAG01_NODE_1371_length_10547_cov_22.320827_6_plen_228_part_00
MADAASAQQKCLSGPAQKYGCTYVFRRTPAAERCISGFCIDNSDKVNEPDVTCPASQTLKPDAEVIAGRTIGDCCIKTGYCSGNSNAAADFSCPAGRSPRPNSDFIKGNTADLCCQQASISGKCTGNSNPATNVVCPSPSTLKSAASSITLPPTATTAALQQQECCETKDMCTGNTLSFPNVICNPSLHSVLKTDAAFARPSPCSCTPAPPRRPPPLWPAPRANQGS